jgi:ABC-2 type transport system permease protein
MTHVFRLYSKVFATGIQGTLVYRWNFLLRASLGFVPLLGTLFLWGAVFQGRHRFDDYTYSSMVAYFISLILLDALSTPVEDEFEIASDIREGRINHVLLKPLNFLAYRFTLFTATRLIYSVVAILPLGLAFFWLRGYYEGIPIASTWPLALLATAGSAVLQFMICYATAMLAFWFLEIGSLVFILFSIEYLAGGHVFPLDLLPPVAQKICLALPFAYEFYFPVAVLHGKITGPAAFTGFLWQGGWILFFFLAGQFLWRRGLKKYTAVGG